MSPPAGRRPASSVRALLPAAELPWRGALVGLGVLLALFGAGVVLYLDERAVRERPVHVGVAREDGCLLDYAAFYWAEVLIALSLTRLVFHGIHLEHRSGGPVDPLLSGEGGASDSGPVRPVVRPVRLRRRATPAGSRVRGGWR